MKTSSIKRSLARKEPTLLVDNNLYFIQVIKRENYHGYPDWLTNEGSDATTLTENIEIGDYGYRILLNTTYPMNKHSFEEMQIELLVAYEEVYHAVSIYFSGSTAYENTNHRVVVSKMVREHRPLEQILNYLDFLVL